MPIHGKEIQMNLLTTKLAHWAYLHLLLTLHLLFTDIETALTSNAAHHLGNKEYFKLCEIKSKKDKYYYIPNSKAINGNFKDLTDLSWFVYKGKKYPEINKQYRVKEGDVIKIGRVWLVIKEIKINSDKVKKENIVDFDNYSQEF